MTCRQMGRPCDFAHHGATADEVVRGRWKRPIARVGWYRKTAREFAALPDD